MPHSSPPEDRLVELEMQLMHLQHEYEQLNSECLKQHTLFENQRQRVERLENLVGQLLARFDSAGNDFGN